MGCILCELLTNKILFHGHSSDDQLQRIIRILGTPRPDQIKKCAPGYLPNYKWNIEKI